MPNCPTTFYLRFLFERDGAWAEKNKENEVHVADGKNYQASFEKDMRVFQKLASSFNQSKRQVGAIFEEILLHLFGKAFQVVESDTSLLLLTSWHLVI